MPNSPTEKSGKRQANLNLRADLWEQFRAVCVKERRAHSAQMEIILEEWLDRYEEKSKLPQKVRPSIIEEPEVTGDTIIWPDEKHRRPHKKDH